MFFFRNVPGFLFGGGCLGCGLMDLSLDPWLCKKCREGLRNECAGKFVSPEAFSFYEMGPIGRKLIHALKYSGMPGMALYLVRNAHSVLNEFREWLYPYKNLFFVPVPLHASRFRERGYNQTERIARALAAACGGKVMNLLFRNSFSTSQTKLSKEARGANVAGVFECKNKSSLAKDDLFVIVDDVFTTGATTGACLYALRKRGFTHLKVCTLLYEQALSSKVDFAADAQMEWQT